MLNGEVLLVEVLVVVEVVEVVEVEADVAGVAVELVGVIIGAVVVVVSNKASASLLNSTYSKDTSALCC